ncbi:nitrite reductase (NAD(P)H) small subunit [Shewanella sp. Choline-02u-19]|jgi:nitrite reductase (NADH) small subunit|uniref:nitrite reductase small subunit NirD n=1 Tax=unclassified Shewanella TaxID=196818 RepID=UPI000C34B161|nr:MULTISPECIES: nitrite reductase small subunit NirD [unclassified Shewanella]PKG56969.1 nitrite reductase (NAD(P)H) small subunit [Shewanella sp. GutDb-MelDb]PKG72611.1 nitrite reductase (NAD(P)H) small subunit [Shewanella sp. GutCb]PKH57011.1 nitrite reductase (NAD(P)H) small subunit [Shewanella sp. Bg11-22]PKI27808.1 nitrite reductase (NAD(P)H) small subunit [Shewanella sp. Choline-02u-19]
MSWVTICEESVLPAKRGVAAWVAGRAVAVFHLGEAGIFAIDNIDPATGVSVLSRGLLCELNNELFVASPIHKQHYSLTTGQCLENEALSVDIFEIKRQSGNVLARALA